MDRNAILGMILSAALSIPIAWIMSSYFHKRSLRSKQISLKYRSEQIYPVKEHSLPSKFKLKYENVNVEKVVHAYFYVWNSGEKGISRADVAPNDPLRFQIRGKFNTLALEIEKFSSTSNEVHLTRSESETSTSFAIDFSYLHPGQGVRISALLTDEIIDVQAFGNLLEAPDGLLLSNIENTEILADTLTLILGLLTLLLPFAILYFNRELMVENSFLIPAFALLPVLMASALPNMLRRHSRMALPPRSLRPAKLGNSVKD